jgi:hypothetical protein
VCACPPQTDKATLSTSYKDVSRPVPSPVPLGASGSGWGSGHQFGGSATYQEFVTRPPSCESVPSHPFTLRSGKSSGWAESVLKVAGVATFPHRGAMLLNPSPAILVGIFSPLSENGSPSPAGILFSFPAGIFSRRAAAICTLGLSRRGPDFRCADCSPQRHGSTVFDPEAQTRRELAEVQDTKAFEILSAFVTSW